MEDVLPLLKLWLVRIHQPFELKVGAQREPMNVRYTSIRDLFVDQYRRFFDGVWIYTHLTLHCRLSNSCLMVVIFFAVRWD